MHTGKSEMFKDLNCVLKVQGIKSHFGYCTEVVVSIAIKTCYGTYISVM